MTTSPVISITDELIADLEAAANATGGIGWHASTAYCSRSKRESRAIYHRPSPSVYVEIIETPDSDPENGESIHAEEYWKYIGLANPATILALLAERAELIKDRTRLEKLAAHAYLIYDRHDVGMWRFPEIVINSTREQCTTDHLRAAIDSMEDDDE